MKKVCVPSLYGLCALFASLPAWAEEGEKASLPQLDVNSYMGQLFWLFLCFPLLYVLLRWVAVPRMEKAQGNRMGLLKADLEAASVANEEAKKIQAAYVAALADAHAKAHATVNEIITAASKEAAEKQAKQRLMIENKMVEAEKKIEAQKQAAFKEVKSAAEGIAATIMEKLAGAKNASQGAGK